MAEADPPINNGEDQSRDKRMAEQKHFKDHVPALVEAGKKIKLCSDHLRRENSVDKRNDLHDRLDAEVAQLHLAINNAVQAPEEVKENTGGVDGPIDQDEFDRAS